MEPLFHRALQGVPPRGRQVYFTFPSAPDPLSKASKAPFLTLRVATPSGAPRQKITAISRLLPLEFWCSEGHFAQFDLIFWPSPTCSDLFCRADLTYFHLFRPIRRADLNYFHLFRPISFHHKAPWTGHLSTTGVLLHLSCDRGSNLAGDAHQSKGKFGHPWRHKPRNGLLRALCGFRRFLESPFEGFRVQGTQKRPSCRTTEGSFRIQCTISLQFSATQNKLLVETHFVQQCTY